MQARLRRAIRAGVACAVIPLSGHAAAPAVGSPAPTLVVKTMDDQQFDLRAHHGEVVVLNFWATWCAPCRKELPVLANFAHAHANEGLTLLAVSLDSASAREEVIRATRALGLATAMAVDATTNGFGMPEAVPMTCVIDRVGAVRAWLKPRHGGLQKEDLEIAVGPLLQ